MQRRGRERLGGSTGEVEGRVHRAEGSGEGAWSTMEQTRREGEKGGRRSERRSPCVRRARRSTARQRSGERARLCGGVGGHITARLYATQDKAPVHASRGRRQTCLLLPARQFFFLPVLAEKLPPTVLCAQTAAAAPPTHSHRTGEGNTAHSDRVWHSTSEHCRIEPHCSRSHARSHSHSALLRSLRPSHGSHHEQHRSDNTQTRRRQ